MTSEDDNMKAYPEVKAGELFTMPPLSVVTFVSEPVDVSSIKKETEDVNFKVHPNPVTDDATISCRDFIRNVMLYDVYGKLIRQQTDINDRISKLSLSGLLAGIYIVRVETDMGYKTQKIIKK